MPNRFLSGINVTGTSTLKTVVNAGVDTDKFLVLDATGNIDFRTGVELLSDISAASAASGLPVGGLAGQILAKIDGTNYNTEWIDNYTSSVKHYVKLGENMTAGTAAYVTGSTGTNMIVSKASNTTDLTSSQTMGIIATTGVTNDFVFLITEGLLAGLNTSTAAIADPVWLGTNGNILFGFANKPVAPAHMVYLGVVTRVNSNNGEIFVKVQNGFEMNEIHNYLEGSVQNNQVIVYESATSLYKPKSISTILGYTPADDSLVVKLAGTQTITGTKIFNADIRLNKTDSTGGVLNIKRGTFIGGINDFTSVFSEGDELSIVSQTSTSVRYAKFSLAGLTSGSIRTYTLPDASGTLALTSDLSGYVPTSRTLTINNVTYDLTANRSWTIDSTNASTRTIQKFTTTAGQTTFTVTGGYTVGMVDVFVNGVKIDNATDFTATNGTTVVLTDALASGQTVEVYKYGSQFIVNNGLRQTTLFSATAGQTTFTVNYSVNMVDVFYNGSKLDSSEYTATNGTSIVFNTACNVNDKVEVISYTYNVGAFTGVGGSGTTNYHAKWTASGTLGNSLIYDDGTNIGIGTASPTSNADRTLHFNNPTTGSAYFKITNTTSGSGINDGLDIGEINSDSYFINRENGFMTFWTNNTERMRITSGGDLFVGSTSFTSPNGADRFIGVYGGQDCSLILQDAVQTWELYVNDDFYINRGSTNVLTALRSNGFVGVNANPSYQFEVNANTNNFVAMFKNTNSSFGNGLYIYSPNNSSSSTNEGFLRAENGAGVKAYIYTNGSFGSATGTYGALASDIRLKENVVEASSKLDDILKLRVVNFNLIEDTNKRKQIGFIAQEFQQVFPSLVYKRDTREYDKDGNVIKGLEDAMGLSVGMEFAILTKAIQEEDAKVNAQELRIQQLEQEVITLKSQLGSN